MDIELLLISVFIPLLTMSIGAYVASKLMIKKAENMIFSIKEDVKEEIEEWLNSEKGQKALMQIGGLIGNGAKLGLGFKGGSGKKGIEGLIMNIINSFVESKLGVSTEPQEPQSKTGVPLA